MDEENLKAEELVNGYICQSCGGAMKFNIKKQKFACAYCGNEAEIKTSKDFVEEYPIETCDAREKDGEIFVGTDSVVCRSCGSEVVFGENQTATVCPMCGSTQVMAQKQSAGISPDGIIPFKIDRKDAEEKFRQWVKKRWFAPNKLKTAHQSQKLTGMYIPFWTYDFDIEAYYNGNGGRTHTVKDKDGKTHTKTVWYPVSGYIRRSFDDVPVCASGSDVNTVVNKILPYSTSGGSLPYDAAYLSGFAAEHYSLKCTDGLNIAKNKAEEEMKSDAHSDIIHKGFDSARVRSIECNYDNVVYKHVMLPAWFSTFTYNGKSYRYIINGETGKVGGERPYSALKITLAVIAAAIIAVLLFMLLNNSGDAAETDEPQSEIIQLCKEDFTIYDLNEIPKEDN